MQLPRSLRANWLRLSVMTELASAGIWAESSPVGACVSGDHYQLMEQLPEELYAPVVTHSLGDLESRVEAILFLRSKLLCGCLPESEMAWPAPVVQQVIFSQVESLGVLPYCRDNVEIVDALLQDLLVALEGLQPLFTAKRAVLLAVSERELIDQIQAELEVLRQRRSKKPKKSPAKSHKIELTPAQRSELSMRADLDAWHQILGQAGSLIPVVWQERVSVWEELFSVFGDLQLVASLGFDFSRGLLQSHGWLNMVKLRELLGKLPQLHQVIQTLGRLKETPGEPIVEIITETIRRSYQVQVDIHTPLVPMETNGVTRSDNISRMLPQEAAMLGHPVLKKLWHARRAEQALVTYRVEGVESQVITREEDAKVERQQAGHDKRKERGPMIICLDTSGSMQGTPEDIAKALVLECLSVASSQKRGCYVYLFGSANEVEELELSADEGGLNRLIGFLCMSFGGGTDVEGPLRKALDKCKDKQWHNADILLVSDGEFGYHDDLVKKIQRRKKSHALGVQGLLIGSHNRVMDRICEPLHHVDRWINLF